MIIWPEFSAFVVYVCFMFCFYLACIMPFFSPLFYRFTFSQTCYSLLYGVLIVKGCKVISKIIPLDTTNENHIEIILSNYCFELDCTMMTKSAFGVLIHVSLLSLSIISPFARQSFSDKLSLMWWFSIINCT